MDNPWIPFAYVAGTAGLLCLLLFLLYPPVRQLRFPAPRWPYASWMGIDVWVVFCVVLAFAPFYVAMLVSNVGVLGWLFPGEANEENLYKARQGILLLTSSAPLGLTLALLYLVRLRNVPLVQIGITRSRWSTSFIQGYLLWLMVTPLVYGIQYLAVNFLIRAPQDAHVHDVAKLLVMPLPPWELVLLLLATLVVAPVQEEFLFRGVLLPWQVKAAPFSHVIVAGCSVMVAMATNADKELSFPPSALFVAAMLPGFLVLPWIKDRLEALLRWYRARRKELHSHLGSTIEEPREKRTLVESLELLIRPALDPRQGPLLACWANGLLFAAFHSSAWPDPVPLLLLGYSLAWLRLRTRTLLAPVAAHFLFNCVAVLEQCLS